MVTPKLHRSLASEIAPSVPSESSAKSMTSPASSPLTTILVVKPVVSLAPMVRAVISPPLINIRNVAPLPPIVALAKDTCAVTTPLTGLIQRRMAQ